MILYVYVNILLQILFVEKFFLLHFHLTIKYYFLLYFFIFTLPRHIISNNSPPGAYSIIKIMSDDVSITSYNLIIFGWRKNLLKRISLFTLSSTSLLFIPDFWRIFAAIFWFIISCTPTIFFFFILILIFYFLRFTFAKEPSPNVLKKR